MLRIVIIGLILGGLGMYSEENSSARPCTDADISKLIEGYKEMSRINLSLANSATAADNDALALCEQKLAECE